MGRLVLAAVLPYRFPGMYVSDTSITIFGSGILKRFVNKSCYSRNQATFFNIKNKPNVPTLRIGILHDLVSGDGALIAQVSWEDMS